MKVVITEAAAADLERIGDWIFEHNPARAVSFVRELRERCERLADAPRAYPLLPRYEHTGVRRRTHRDYLIFYRVHAGTIDVLRVLHGAQDYGALLFPE